MLDTTVSGGTYSHVVFVSVKVEFAADAETYSTWFIVRLSIRSGGGNTHITGVTEHGALEGLISMRWKNLNTGFGRCRSRTAARVRSITYRGGPVSLFIPPPPCGVPASVAGLGGRARFCARIFRGFPFANCVSRPL